MRHEHAVKEALNRTLVQIVETSPVELLLGDAHFEGARTIAQRRGLCVRIGH